MNIRLRVRGWSCEPNNQLNVCTTSVTEGEVGSLSPPVIDYRPFQGGGSDVVSVSCFGVRVSVMFHFILYFEFSLGC